MEALCTLILEPISRQSVPRRLNIAKVGKNVDKNLKFTTLSSVKQLNETQRCVLVGLIITDGLAVDNNKRPFKFATNPSLPHFAEALSLSTALPPPSLFIFSLLGAPFAVPSPPLLSW
ncbi:hypothetical protein PIB30_028421 [Stylosanthes scabra]|uniref:Uncharacterized protein n=1 Tax=Stylosanthes scabra TaxID=79078 RepID=A0ABU6VB51_9FABA|nr:hypothetical protein [Stylosanthes scabra]